METRTRKELTGGWWVDAWVNGRWYPKRWTAGTRRDAAKAENEMIDEMIGMVELPDTAEAALWPCYIHDHSACVGRSNDDVCPCVHHQFDVSATVNVPAAEGVQPSP